MMRNEGNHKNHSVTIKEDREKGGRWDGTDRTQVTRC